MQKFILSLFFLIASIHLFSHTLDLQWLAMITKPGIMMSLISLILMNDFLEKDKKSLLLLGALLALVGDVFLMFSSKLMFIFGLVAFLSCHVFYILLYLKNHEDKSNLAKKLIPFLFILIYAISYGIFILPKTNNLFFAVLAYIIVISSMCYLATQRYKDTIYFKVILGSIFFIVSDSLLAYRMFVDRFFFDSLFVMLTYILAQYLIVTSFIKNRNLKS